MSPAKVLTLSNPYGQGSPTTQSLSFATQGFDEWLVLQKTAAIVALGMEEGHLPGVLILNKYDATSK